MVSETDEGLPFGCTVRRVETLNHILRQFLECDYPNSDELRTFVEFLNQLQSSDGQETAP